MAPSITIFQERPQTLVKTTPSRCYTYYSNKWQKNSNKADTEVEGEIFTPLVQCLLQQIEQNYATASNSLNQRFDRLAEWVNSKSRLNTKEVDMFCRFMSIFSRYASIQNCPIQYVCRAISFSQKLIQVDKTSEKPPQNKLYYHLQPTLLVYDLSEKSYRTIQVEGGEAITLSVNPHLHKYYNQITCFPDFPFFSPDVSSLEGPHSKRMNNASERPESLSLFSNSSEESSAQSDAPERSIRSQTLEDSAQSSDSSEQRPKCFLSSNEEVSGQPDDSESSTNPQASENNVPTLFRSKRAIQQPKHLKDFELNSGSDTLSIFREKGVEYTNAIRVDHLSSKDKEEFENACLAGYRQESKAKRSQRIKSYIQSISKENPDVKLLEIRDVEFTLENGAKRKEKGVFAKRLIKKGEIVGIYAGDIVRIEGLEDKTFLFEFNMPQLALWGIDARRAGNISRFINHSASKENLVPHIFCDQDLSYIAFEASRDINKGEQLFFDYGSGYHWPEGVILD